jgi:hypothetical protein
MKTFFLIGVLGMKHCGSTMIYSVLIDYFTSLGYVCVNSCQVIQDPDSVFVHSLQDASYVCIVKRHDFDQSLVPKLAVCILPVRDVRDISISGFHRFCLGNKYLDHVREPLVREQHDNVLLFGLYYFIQSMNDNIHMFLQWNSACPSPIFIKYEDLMMNKLHRFENIICKTTGIVCDVHILERCIRDQENMYTTKKNIPKNLCEFSKSPDCQHLLLQDHDTSGGQTKKYETYFNQYEQEIIMRDPRILSFLDIFNYTK